MTITFKCTCGAEHTAEEAKAGELFHCASCGVDFPVPPQQPAQAAEVQAAVASDAPVAEVVAEPPKPDAADHMQALRAELGGKGGADEMVAQMKAARGGAAAGDSPQAETLAAGIKAARPAPARPPTGKQRAATHIGFKRVMWLPSLIIGLLCLGVGLYCFIPKASIKAPELLYKDKQVVADGQDYLWLLPADMAPEKIDRAAGGKVYFLDKTGKRGPACKVNESTNGKLAYLNEAGYDELARPADGYAETMAAREKAYRDQAGRESHYMWFGISLSLVGLVLMGLSLWMWHDVRLVGQEET